MIHWTGNSFCIV
jgi:hypothetical protein